jgi:hypothetical protein
MVLLRMSTQCNVPLSAMFDPGQLLRSFGYTEGVWQAPTLFFAFASIEHFIVHHLQQS